MRREHDNALGTGGPDNEDHHQSPPTAATE